MSSCAAYEIRYNQIESSHVVTTFPPPGVTGLLQPQNTGHHGTGGGGGGVGGGGGARGRVGCDVDEVDVDDAEDVCVRCR